MSRFPSLLKPIKKQRLLLWKARTDFTFFFVWSCTSFPSTNFFLKIERTSPTPDLVLQPLLKCTGYPPEVLLNKLHSGRQKDELNNQEQSARNCSGTNVVPPKRSTLTAANRHQFANSPVPMIQINSSQNFFSPTAEEWTSTTYQKLMAKDLVSHEGHNEE